MIKVNRVLISYFGLALAASVFVLLGSSCSVRKYIPEGQTLYTGADLELDTIGEVRDYKELKLLLEELHFPKPNGKFLGTRPGLFFHYKSRADSGWIFRFLDRKMGEEPVFLEEVDRQSVEDLMLNRLGVVKVADLGHLVCAHCTRIIDQLHRTDTAFDWAPRGARLHAHSRFNGRTLCGYHQKGER